MNKKKICGGGRKSRSRARIENLRNPRTPLPRLVRRGCFFLKFLFRTAGRSENPAGLGGRLPRGNVCRVQPPGTRTRGSRPCPREIIYTPAEPPPPRTSFDFLMDPLVFRVIQFELCLPTAVRHRGCRRRKSVLKIPKAVAESAPAAPKPAGRRRPRPRVVVRTPPPRTHYYNIITCARATGTESKFNRIKKKKNREIMRAAILQWR